MLEQRKNPALKDMVVVSTCNRTEVYAMTEDADCILSWLAQVNNIDVKQLIHHVYRYENAGHYALDASSEWFDSLMLGEPQILGQVKSALALSKDAETVSAELNSVFEYAFYAAKEYAQRLHWKHAANGLCCCSIGITGIWPS